MSTPETQQIMHAGNICYFSLSNGLYGRHPDMRMTNTKGRQTERMSGEKKEEILMKKNVNFYCL